MNYKERMTQSHRKERKREWDKMTVDEGISLRGVAIYSISTKGGTLTPQKLQFPSPTAHEISYCQPCIRAVAHCHLLILSLKSADKQSVLLLIRQLVDLLSLQ